MEVIVGFCIVFVGELIVDGRDFMNVLFWMFIDNGVLFVFEDRNCYGFVGDFFVMYNVVMKDFCEDCFGSGVMLDYGEFWVYVEVFVEVFDVCGVYDVIDVMVGDFLGGNL